MNKMIYLVFALLMTVALFAGCSEQNPESDLEYILNNGKIVVGITEYAPMDFKDENGEWTGFDAEFSRLFAEELGVECEFYVIADWSKKFYELETKQIDVIWNGMTINEDVTLNTSCSNPYVINAQVVVMKSDRIASYPHTASLASLTVAVEDGSAGQDAAIAAGIRNIIPLRDQAAALMEVAAGTSDACVIDITMAYAMTGEGTSYADLGFALRLTEEEYGVGFRKGSDVTDRFNEFMAKLMADGTLDALAEKYDLTLVK